MSIKAFFVLFCSVFIQLFANSELVQINEDSKTDDYCPTGLHYSTGHCIRDNPKDYIHIGSKTLDRIKRLSKYCRNNENCRPENICPMNYYLDENGNCQPSLERKKCPPGTIPDGFGNCKNQRNGNKIRPTMRCRPDEIDLGNGICVNIRTGKFSQARKECPPGQTPNNLGKCVRNNKFTAKKCRKGEVPHGDGICVPAPNRKQKPARKICPPYHKFEKGICVPLLPFWRPG